MRSSFAAVFLFGALASAQTWQTAVPRYQYQFPRDHFSHPDYQTEWWYYTGNLRDVDGHRYGFELTFFREAVRLPKRTLASEAPAWRPDQIYLAHLAFSDLDGREFYHTERINRAGPALAGAGNGAKEHEHRYWNGNWQVLWTSTAAGEQQLRAVTDRLQLELALNPQKAPVIHGKEGVSVKGPLPGEASQYISFTRLQATGRAQWHGQAHQVHGIAWMDHEFFTEPRDNSLAGWDWFAIQLDSGQELMLYRLRTSSGQVSPYSSGTYVDANGNAQFLSAGEFVLTPIESWRSKLSGASYPVGWRISVPSLDLELTEETSLKNQELFNASGITPTYWEGAVTYKGRKAAQAASGVGYLEMTGYDKQMELSSK